MFGRILMSAPLFWGMLPSSAQAESLTLVTMPIPGMTYCCDEADKPVGPLLEVVHAAMQSAGLSYKTKLMPWARATYLARTAEKTCAIGMRRSDDNRHQYKWAGPLMRGSVRILRRHDDSFRPSSEEHLAGKTVGVLRGSVYIPRLERAGAKVEQADTLAINVGKLVARRIDLIATSADRAEENGPIVEAFRIDVGDAYLACHPGMEDAVMARLNDALSSARHAGAMRQFGL